MISIVYKYYSLLLYCEKKKKFVVKVLKILIILSFVVKKNATCTVYNILFINPYLKKYDCMMNNKKFIFRNMSGNHLHNFVFLPLFISVQFPNCNIFFVFFYTQDTAMHNSKFKKSIASTTIKNSLFKTSFPHCSFVLFQRWGKAC